MDHARPGWATTSAPTDNAKRPSGHDLEGDQQYPKSTRRDYESITPRGPSNTPQEELDAAQASQLNLLNTLNSYLRRGGHNAPGGSSSESESQSGERTPVVSDFRPRFSISGHAMSGGSPPRPYQPSSRRSSTTSFMSAQSDNQTHPADQVQSRRKGKQKATDGPNQSFDASSLNLPPWPGFSSYQGIPLNLGPRPAPSASSLNGGPSALASNNDSPANNGPSGTPGSDPSSGMAGLGQILSYFSQGMDHLLSSLQRQQASSQEVILRWVESAIQELKTSRPATSASATTAMNASEEVLGFPPIICHRTAKRRKHFIPSSNIPSSSDVEDHKRFMSCIRAHALTMLRISSYKYLSTIKCDLTDEEVEDFELDSPDAIEITPDQFLVNCLGGIRSLFNQTAAIVFAEDFLEKVTDHDWYSEEKIPARYLQRHIIAQAFQSHLVYIKTRYRQVVVAPREDPMAAKDHNDARLQRSSRGSRKTRLLKLQLSAMTGSIELSKHIPLVRYLGTQVVSSDESEDGVRRTINYPRVYPRWRSKRLAALMWKVDTVIEGMTSVPLGIRKKAGALLRRRPHTQKYNDKAPAPIGLPRNCYDGEWLANLPPCILKALQVVDRDYDFDMESETPVAPEVPPSNQPGPSLMPPSMGPSTSGPQN